MGADCSAENTSNAPEFICPICLPKPKSSEFQWKHTGRNPGFDRVLASEEDVLLEDALLEDAWEDILLEDVLLEDVLLEDVLIEDVLLEDLFIEDLLIEDLFWP